MESFVVVLHLIVAFVLIVLVLVQDSKGGGLGAFGGGSSSVFGATGAATLAQKLTRWTAVVFACTCIALSIFVARGKSSVVDGATLPTPVNAATATEAAPTPAPETATPSTQPQVNQ